MIQTELDLADGERRRDEGMARVWSNTDQGWRAAALGAIKTLAAMGRRFTSEEVRALAGDPPRPNAMGAAFMAASRSGWIRKTGYRKATRPSLHATELAEWVGERS